MKISNTLKRLFLAMAGATLLSGICYAGDASTSTADPVLDMPTLHSLGVYWIIGGDDNQNAKIDFDYRKASTDAWHKGPPLWRMEKGANKNEKGESSVIVPEGSWLFAGSILLLEPDTNYEMKLTLWDPDGGNSEKLLKQATIGEPIAPNGPQKHVAPGNGGGSGTASDPFKGLDAAQQSAQPGDTFLLHKGTYSGSFKINKNGEPGKPILWRGAGDGEAFIDGQHPHDKLEGSAIEASNAHDVWFEGLSAGNADSAIHANEAARIVVRRCHLHDCICGFRADRNRTGNVSGFFLADNLIEGITPWPITGQQWHDLPESRGVWITGQGHDVCFNRIHNMKDGVDTDNSIHSSAIDFHNNDISEMYDDGSEMDGSERNTRNFYNRYTNTLTGLSFQPVYGGPVYAFRNVCYNFKTEPLKLKSSPSGAVIFQNTFVHAGLPVSMQTPKTVHHCYLRNNIFLGTEGRAIDFSPKASNCDLDYDGFGGYSGDVFMKLNGSFKTPDDVRARSPLEKHVVLLDPATLFASGLKAPEMETGIDAAEIAKGTSTMGLKKYDPAAIDPRLKAGSAAVDAGEILPGFNDGYNGSAPDLGAVELNGPLPHYGPRPVTP